MKRIDNLFYFVPILLLVNIVMRWEFTKTWSNDTISYILIADKLPIIENSIFPIFYPLCLKIVNLFFGDYVLSSKVLAVISVLFSLGFVRWKDFYWREIWTLLTFYSFLSIIPWSLSEVIFIPLLIMFFYYNHQFLLDKIFEKEFICYSILLLVLIVITKYSSLFYVGAIAIFTIFLYWTKDKKYKSYLKVLVLSSICILIYLAINYIFTGYFMGERGESSISIMGIKRSFSQILLVLSPFFYNYYSELRMNKHQDVLIFFVFIVVQIFRVLKKNILIERLRIKKITGRGNLLVLCILCSFSFLAGTIYSYFYINIDDLSFRLLLGYYIFLFFAVILSLPKSESLYKILLFFAIFNVGSDSIRLKNKKFEKVKIIEESPHFYKIKKIK